LGNSEIGNSAIREIARSCHNLKFLGLECCSGISRKVLGKLDRNIEIEWPDSDSDNESVQNLSGPEW
ncbi:16096_t:CDS:1, partial [Funneliformis geosporum]